MWCRGTVLRCRTLQHLDTEPQHGTHAARFRFLLQTETMQCLFNSDVKSWLKNTCWRERTKQTLKSAKHLIMGWVMLVLGVVSSQCSVPFLLLGSYRTFAEGGKLPAHQHPKLLLPGKCHSAGKLVWLFGEKKKKCLFSQDIYII